jgi:hypothetical protein
MLDPNFAARASGTYQLAELMRQLMQRYFIADFFEVETLVGETRVQEFQAVVGLVVELVWLTNNIIIEELDGYQGQKDQGSLSAQKQDPLEVLHGLDQVYIRFITGFACFEQELQQKLNSVEPVLSDQFWDVVAWGMASLIQFLKPKDQIVEIVEGRIADLERQPAADAEREAAVQRLQATANEYFVPYLVFARDYFDKILPAKEAKLKTLTDPAKIKEAESKLLEAKRDLCKFLQHGVKTFDDQHILVALFRPPIEEMVFSLFRTFDPRSVVACNTVVGQFIALHDDGLSEKYIKERNLLAILAEILSKGSLEMRKEALWMLQNIACGTKSADLMVRSETEILEKIMGQLKTQRAGARAEAALCLANIFHNGTID